MIFFFFLKKRKNVERVRPINPYVEDLFYLLALLLFDRAARNRIHSKSF